MQQLLTRLKVILLKKITEFKFKVSIKILIENGIRDDRHGFEML